MQSTLTADQLAVTNALKTQFGIDPEHIRFLNAKRPNEPWLSADVLGAIARQSGEFQGIEEAYDRFIEPLSQVVHRAEVRDREGRTFARTGIAAIGEHEEIDAHVLAASRALRAALDMAGFNPLRGGSKVPMDKSAVPQSALPPELDESVRRQNDLARIHILAKNAGLIRKNSRKYLDWLAENFGVSTAAALDSTGRQSVISALSKMVESR